MGTVERSIEVGVPLSVAYDQWTRFEDFPRFMEGVEEIRQIDDTHMFWRVKLAGTTREFHAEILEQRPEERIAWRSSEGAMHAGVATFEPIDDEHTRVVVRIHEEPDGVTERLGEALGMLDRRVTGDLERFKAMVEASAAENGDGRADSDRARRFERTAGDEAPADADTVAHPTEATAGGPGPTPVRQQAGF